MGYLTGNQLCNCAPIGVILVFRTWRRSTVCFAARPMPDMVQTLSKTFYLSEVLACSPIVCRHARCVHNTHLKMYYRTQIHSDPYKGSQTRGPCHVHAFKMTKRGLVSNKRVNLLPFHKLPRGRVGLCGEAIGRGRRPWGRKLALAVEEHLA